MSYVDLEEARAKLAEEDVAKAVKGMGKRDRKSQNARARVLESTAVKSERVQKSNNAMSEIEAEADEDSKAKKLRTSETLGPARAVATQIGQVKSMLVPWKISYSSDTAGERCSR